MLPQTAEDWKSAFVGSVRPRPSDNPPIHFPLPVVEKDRLVDDVNDEFNVYQRQRCRAHFPVGRHQIHEGDRRSSSGLPLGHWCMGQQDSEPIPAVVEGEEDDSERYEQGRQDDH